MPHDTTNWLIAINGGCCPEATPKGILNNKPDASKDSQKWAVEKGDRPEKVAFYNVAEKKYLRTNNGNAATRVELGEKQWWMLERDGDAGTYWIKCDDFDNAYLCNSYAKHTEDNVVYMWPKQVGQCTVRMHVRAALTLTRAAWQHSMRWYIQDAGVHDFTTGTGGNSGAADAEIAEREEALAQKEKDLAAKEAEQKLLAEQLNTKEKELEEQARSKVKTTDDASRAEKEWADKLADLQHQLDAVRANERDVASKEAEIEKIRQQNDDKTAELWRREQELLQQETAANSDLDRVKAENSNLKQETTRLKKQLDDARKSSAPKTTETVEAQELAKLRTENRRLRDLIVDNALKAQDSNRTVDSAPTTKPKQTPRYSTASLSSPQINQSTVSPSPKQIPQSTVSPSSPQINQSTVSLSSPQSNQLNVSPSSPQPVPTRKTGATAPIRTHADGTASPRPSANSSNPIDPSPTASSKASVKPQPTKSVASSKPAAATPKPNEVEQSKEENDRPKQQTAHTQKGRKGLYELPNGANTSPKIVAGPGSKKGSKGQGADEDAIVFNCGHVVHPPPRKLERRVLGIMYE